MAIGRIPEPGTGIPESIVDAKGDIVTATAADTPARLAVGTTEHRLVAASGEATGLKYVADTTNYAVAAKGDLLVGTAADTLAPLTVGANGTTLVADSAETTGLKWATPSSGGMTLLSTTTLSGTSTNITGISQDYTDLLVLYRGMYVNTATPFEIKPNGQNTLNKCSGTYGNAAYVMDEIRGIFNLPTSDTPTIGGFLKIYGYAGTTYGKPFQFAACTTANAVNFGGCITTASAITSLNFTTENGTSTYSGGQVLIYGVK
jgi:hypothetical protein